MSYLNIISNLIIIFIQTVGLFITRTFFIKILGEQYLGLDGLYTNILSMLAIAELGIGTAISYHLFLPLANNNYEKVEKIMNYLKKCYFKIALVILALGICIMPFLSYFVKDYSANNLNIYLIFFIYLIDVVSGYSLIYKESLLIADQRKHKLTKYNVAFNTIQYIVQIIILLYTKNFLLYLLSQIIIRFVQRLIINRYITKYYYYIKFDRNNQLSDQEIKKIKKDVSGLVFHKVGNYCINGTDNIIISFFINVTAVGIYGNYLSIFTMIKNLLSSITNGISPSFGNLIVETDNETQENVFKIIDFINFIFFGFSTLIILFLINPFINLWVGEKYLFSNIVVYILSINFYVSNMLLPLDTVKTMAGIYNDDKYVSIIQAGTNLILSILLVLKFGIMGVFLGTTISYLLTVFWQKPYIVYNDVFNKNCREYFLIYFKNSVIMILSVLCIKIVLNVIDFNFNSVYMLIIAVAIIFLIFIIILVIFYYRSYVFNYLINQANKFLNKKDGNI